MAERNLRAAFDAIRRHPQRAAELGVDEEEAASWRDAAQAMLIAFDEQRGVHAQAQSYTEHEVWDFAATSTAQYPLFLHFPYFDLYRKQALGRLAFRLCVRGRRLLVEVGHEQATYSLLRGSTLQIIHHGEKATVHAKRPVTRPVPAALAVEKVSQPAGRAPRRRGEPSRSGA